MYNGWVLAVAPPLSEVHADLNGMKLQMIAITVLSIICVIIISEKISIVITKPVKELTTYVEYLDDLTEPLRLPEELSNDKTEIGYLGRALEDMNMDLFKAYSDLYDQNKELDCIVWNRTQQLTESNDELRAAIESLEETQSKLVKAEIMLL